MVFSQKPKVFLRALSYGVLLLETCTHVYTYILIIYIFEPPDVRDIQMATCMFKGPCQPSRCSQNEFSRDAITGLLLRNLK